MLRSHQGAVHRLLRAFLLTVLGSASKAAPAAAGERELVLLGRAGGCAHQRIDAREGRLCSAGVLMRFTLLILFVPLAVVVAVRGGWKRPAVSVLCQR
jgi:hypothetical protein